MFTTLGLSAEFTPIDANGETVLSALRVSLADLDMVSTTGRGHASRCGLGWRIDRMRP
jgi:hypothetical protein